MSVFIRSTGQDFAVIAQDHRVGISSFDILEDWKLTGDGDLSDTLRTVDFQIRYTAQTKLAGLTSTPTKHFAFITTLMQSYTKVEKECS